MKTTRLLSAAILVLALLIRAPALVSSQEVCQSPWSLQETLRIGSVDGPDALSTVWDLEVGPSGEVFVTQYFTPHVTVFGPDGRFMRRIGRGGQGPGEFDFAAMHLGWFNDTLWVSDGSTLHFFDSDDTETRQVSFDTRLLEQGSRFLSGIPLADGTYLGLRGLIGDIPAFYAASDLSIPRLSADGEILDTIVRVRQRVRARMGDAYAPHPLDGGWGAGLPYSVVPGGSALILVGDVRVRGASSSFDLLSVGIAGDTIMRRTIQYDARQIMSADRRWLTEVYGNYMAGDYESGPYVMSRSAAAKGAGPTRLARGNRVPRHLSARAADRRGPRRIHMVAARTGSAGTAGSLGGVQ